ncbi:hypothetical protein GCK32_021553 [Trichostrongylus colubriformis]|uniref:Uncharacterized protein n=1 Tax=Trichostrongylus colubriformis TaxID=6319 RepID=A0AAN8FZP0_TRICO
MDKKSNDDIPSKEDVKTAREPRRAQPAPLEGEIRLQLRKKKHHRFRKYYAVLTKGFLSLFTNSQDQHYKYQIDLAKVRGYCDEYASVGLSHG